MAGMLSVSMLCSPVLASGNVSRERLEKSRARQNADLLIVTGKLDGAEIGGLATLAAGVGVDIGAGETRAVLQKRLDQLMAQNEELAGQNRELVARNEELAGQNKKLTEDINFYRKYYGQNRELQTQNEGLRAENERLAARERKLVTQNGELALKNGQLTQEVDFYRRFKANSEVQAQLEKLETENAQLLAQNGKLQTHNVSLQSDLVREELLREAQAAENRHLRKQWWDMTKAQRIDDILKLEQEYAVSLRNKGGKLLHLGDLYSQEQIYFLNQLVWEEAEIPSVIKYNGRAFAIKEGYEKTFFRSVYEIYNNSRWPFKKEMVVTPKTGALFAMVYRKAEMMPELVGRWLTDQYSSGGIDFVVLKSYVKEVPVSAVAKSSLRLVGKKVVLKSLPAAVGVGLLGGAFAWANAQAQEQEILARVEANPSLWMNLSDEDFERVVQSPKLAERYLAFNDALHELAQVPSAELQQVVQEAQQYEKQQQTVRAQQLRHELTGRLAF